MPTAKEEVRQLLDTLPDDTTLEDIQYHLYVRERIAFALEEEKAGKLIDREEIERRVLALLESPALHGRHR